jgi:hypothetical protein
MRRRLFFIFLLAALAAGTRPPAQGQGQKPAGAKAEVNWLFDAREDGDGIPHTKVSLAVGDRRVFLEEVAAKFAVLERRDYKSHGVPASALTACSGWWAGAGEDLYVVRRRGSLVVYSRTLDEQAPVGAYKRLKVIPSP